ncbi:MAG: calcium/sodium antiporter [Candidatus Aminicenantes bacterium]|jgi:cation:H+ antiporter|nr:calcium/sodium antiporter [Candidatus Aminicenantes bacterium]
MIYLYFIALIASFVFLFKSASFFVEAASGIAKAFNISKMVIGIVLVGMATTAPEFFVSVIAAIRGKPEFALGNAVGSVICDDGIALALAAILAPTVIYVNCRVLKVVGAFLLSIDILVYILARNGTIGRLEGVLFVLILCVYYIFILKRKDFRFAKDSPETRRMGTKGKSPGPRIKPELRRFIQLFILGLGGVVVTSSVVVWAAEHIAEHFSVSETIIGLIVLAIGTSLPEISTCVTAAVKGEGEMAVGNIIGADILNVLWIIGVSSIVNPITVELKVMNFTFPYMILIVLTMLVLMRIGCRLGKIKGLILFALYILYLFLTLKLFM